MSNFFSARTTVRKITSHTERAHRLWWNVTWTVKSVILSTKSSCNRAQFWKVKGSKGIDRQCFFWARPTDLTLRLRFLALSWNPPFTFFLFNVNFYYQAQVQVPIPRSIFSHPQRGFRMGNTLLSSDCKDQTFDLRRIVLMIVRRFPRIPTQATDGIP